MLAAAPAGHAGATAAAPPCRPGASARWPPAARLLARGRGPGRAAGAGRDATERRAQPAASGTPDDLREAGEKAARAKRLNPFAVEPLFAQASIAERGNRPRRRRAACCVEAVERQPDNPAVWARFALPDAVDDAAGALRSPPKLVLLDPGRYLDSVQAQLAFYDEARSASATGTPLPET